MLRFKGGAEKRFGGVTTTLGWLVSRRRGGRARAGNVSLVDKPKKISHSLALQSWLYMPLHQVVWVFFTVCAAGKKYNSLTVVASTPLASITCH